MPKGPKPHFWMIGGGNIFCILQPHGLCATLEVLMSYLIQKNIFPKENPAKMVFEIEVGSKKFSDGRT